MTRAEGDTALDTSSSTLLLLEGLSEVSRDDVSIHKGCAACLLEE